MFTSQENEEPVAFLDCVEFDSYNCEPASGYICEKENETVFSVTSLCTPITNFSFFAEGEKPIPCMSKQKEKKLSGQNSGSNKAMDFNFQNDASVNSNQGKNVIIVAVCTTIAIGVIVTIATVTTLYCLLKRGVLPSHTERKGSEDIISKNANEEERSPLSEDLP